MSVKPIRRASHLDVGKLLFVGAIWGASFIFIASALESFGPVSIAAWRIALGAMVLLLACLVSGQSLPRQLADWRKMILIGIFNSALPFFLLGWGMQFISSAEAALLVSGGTFSALILSHFITMDERINIARMFGVLAGFTGVVVLVFHELSSQGPGGIRGQLAAVGAGMSYSVSSVMSRRLSHLPSLPAAAGILTTGACYMLPLAYWLENPVNLTPEPVALGSLCLLGLLSTGLAYTIRLHIIRHNGAVFMSQVGYLVPLFGVFWAWMLLDEKISSATLMALGAILLGILITRQGTK